MNCNPSMIVDYLPPHTTSKSTYDRRMALPLALLLPENTQQRQPTHYNRETRNRHEVLTCA